MNGTSDKFYKDNDLFKEIINSWLSSLKRFESGLDGNCLFVAIARKATQIVRYGRAALNIDLPIVSEIALPFLSMEKYRSAVILDDAIYYGSTFKKVQNLVIKAFQQSGIEDIGALPIIPAPIVRAKKNCIAPNKFVFEKEVLPIREIEESDIPFFINSIIDIIHFDNSPYDVEVPVLRYEFEKEFDDKSSEEFVKLLVESIEYRFDEKIDYYNTSRNNYLFSEKESIKKDISYTILLNPLFEYKLFSLSPDIAKLRLTFNGNRVSVSAYCINALNSSNLCKDSTIFDKDVNEKVWNHLVSRIEENKNKKHQSDNRLIDNPIFSDVHPENIGIFLDRLDKEWEYQCEKSLCVMANYILSYFMFKSLMPAIGPLFDSECRLDEADLRNLVGDFAPIVIDGLNSTDQNVFIMDGPLSQTTGKSIIPLKYKAGYLEELSQDLKAPQLSYVDTSFASIFGAMHRKIEIKSRSTENDLYERLRFGESIKSLFNRLTYLDKTWDSPKRRAEVHKALDSSIDNGSVVPNYVRLNKENGEYYWNRLFRSGENDDNFRDQYMRNLLYVFTNLCRLSDWVTLSREQADFAFLLIAYFSNNPKLFGSGVAPVYRNGTYQAFIKIKEHTINIVDWAVGARVLCAINDSQLSVADTSISDDLVRGNILTRQEEREIDDILNICSRYFSLVKDSRNDLRNLLNILYFDHQKSKLEENLINWKNKFRKVLDSIIQDGALTSEEKGKKIIGLDRRFFMSYRRIPYKNSVIMDEWLKEIEQPFITDIYNKVVDESFTTNIAFWKADCAFVMTIARAGLYGNEGFPEFLKLRECPVADCDLKINFADNKKILWSEIINDELGVKHLRENVSDKEFCDAVDSLINSLL